MRRNWDTIRTILFACEREQNFCEFITQQGVGLEHAVRHHVNMLEDADYMCVAGGKLYMEWPGRDLLDAIRDDEVWVLLKRVIEGNAGGMPTDLLLYVARAAIEAKGRGLLPR